MTTQVKHTHQFVIQKSGIKTCSCGAFRHKEGGVAIVEQRDQVKHTATPWNIETLEHGKSSTTGEQYYDHILQPLNVLIEQGMNKKSVNANFILKAVNSHEALVNALSSWVETEEENHRDTQGHDVASCNYCIAVEALKLAK